MGDITRHTEEELTNMTHKQLDDILANFGFKPSGNAKSKKISMILKNEEEALAKVGERTIEDLFKDVITEETSEGTSLSKDAVQAIIARRRKETTEPIGKSYVDAVINRRLGRGGARKVFLTPQDIIKARSNGIKVTK